MSTTSQMYSDFKAVTELFTQLNRALITAKRVVLRDTPQPEQSAQELAQEILGNFLTNLKQGLAARPEELPPAVLEVLETVRNGRLPSGEPIEKAIDRCLARLSRGLRALRSEDLGFLDRFTAILDKSSESLYRQMARL